MLSCCSIAFCFLPNERKTTPPNYVYRPPNARPIHLSVGGNSCPTRSHRMRRLRKPPTHLCGPFCVNLSRPHNIQRHRSSALPPTAVCCKRPVCSSFGMFVLLSMSVLRFKVRVQPPSATCGPLGHIQKTDWAFAQASRRSSSSSRTLASDAISVFSSASISALATSPLRLAISRRPALMAGTMTFTVSA